MQFSTGRQGGTRNTGVKRLFFVTECRNEIFLEGQAKGVDPKLQVVNLLRNAHQQSLQGENNPRKLFLEISVSSLNALWKWQKLTERSRQNSIVSNPKRRETQQLCACLFDIQDNLYCLALASYFRF